jgi:hypothetical protein
VAVAVVIGLAITAVWFRHRDTLPETPSAAIAALFDAADQGDGNAYLRVTGGQLRRSLEQARAEMGESGFRDHLRRSVDDIKGLAILGDAEGSEDEKVLVIELVFVDRIEQQRVAFARRRDGWLITSMEMASLVKPPIPYRTPVFEEPLPDAGRGNADEQDEM